MTNHHDLMKRLKEMLKHKKKRSFYAKRLGISEEHVIDLIKKIRKEENWKKSTDHVVSEVIDNQVVKCEEDVSSGKKELIYNSSEEIKTLDDLIEKCNIDTEFWNIDKYIQNYWGNSGKPYWQVKAWLSRKNNEQVFQDEFIKFLSSYKPVSNKVFGPRKTDKPNGCLVINKQDSHLNKKDIETPGSIAFRGFEIEERVETIISQASLSNNLSSIKYIVGSDEFNSEWTNATTKGTPQQNTDSYQQSFEKICNHEISMINLLLRSSHSVEVIYVPGNHDEYVGWHLINWLSAYFRNEISSGKLIIDTSPNYRKYVSFGTSAMMFNHGDVIKPSKLASIFPMEFKDEWSNFDHFYIFTGDKHHELSQDFNGIKFYQIPAFSKATSQWDSKNGYTCSKGEVTAFLIEEEQGMTNIFKQYL